MERGEKVEILLPESIIQDIQSRLSRKEAARTTALSESWYRASLTRADVVLDDRGFLRNPDRFSELARKTMRRYDELNLSIETFRLCMESAEGDRCLLAVELLQKAMEFGANDFNVEFRSRGAGKMEFVFPVEVFGSEKLVGLSVKGFQCQIDIGEDGKVDCSSLKTLELCDVHARGDAIWGIILSCPLIENLTLSRCRFLYEKRISLNQTSRMGRYMDLGPLAFGKQEFIHNPNDHYVFRSLKNLVLSYVKVDPLFFRDFSTKFPCLKGLTLSHCLGPKHIKISSQSLECIKVDQAIRLKAGIKAPNLLVFTCSSGHIPVLTFGKVPTKFESHIHARCTSGLSVAWFEQFESFLGVMKVSELSLGLSFGGKCPLGSFVYVGLITPLRHILEGLTIEGSALESSLFWDGLFWSCCPRSITATCRIFGYEARLKKFVSNRMMKAGENCYIPNKGVFGQSTLEEVTVEVFGESVADQWEPVTWKTLLDASTVKGTERNIRFHFKWEDWIFK